MLARHLTRLHRSGIPVRYAVDAATSRNLIHLMTRLAGMPARVRGAQPAINTDFGHRTPLRINFWGLC